MKVRNLKSGDLIELAGEQAMVILTKSPHPFYPHCWLVVWSMSDGSLSWDALNPNQEVGDWINNDQERLRRLFQPGS